MKLNATFKRTRILIQTMTEPNTHTEPWCVIANPTAGRHKVGRRWPFIEKALRAALPVGEVILTQHREQAIVLTAEAVRRGYRRFIAVGGDGTNHEVINGLMAQREVPPAALTYVLLPVGTGNDWIRTYGIPRDLPAWLDMVRAGRVFRQDIGVVEYKRNGQAARRYFTNVAGLAYDAFVVAFAEKHRARIYNRFVYLALILRCLFRYRLQRARVRFDGQEREGRFYTINAGIGRYSGGGMSLVPQSVPDDGRLALTLAGPVSKLGVLLNTWRFYNGSIGRHPLVDLYHAHTIEIDSLDDRPLPLEADGEFLGETPVRFTLRKKALRLIVPSDFSPEAP